MTTTQTLRETPFAAFHRENGAKMVDFAGWSMPLHYGSIIEEHHQVRRSGGIFDVSHMGRFTFKGKDARRFLDQICSRQVAGMQDGQARYGMVCNEKGGCHDDVLVYKLADADYMMVCNASNREKLLDHIAAKRGDLVFKFEDITLKSGMLAVQGPEVMPFIGKYSTEIPALKRYRFLRKTVLGLEVMVSRTGYTGEDGVEVIFRTDSFIAKTAIKMLLKDLTAAGDILKPAGLGARDSLRLEAAMALYGHEITEEIDPVSANLGFAMKLTKGDDDPDVGRFIGQDALIRIKEEGPPRKLVGLELEGRRAARQEMTVMSGENTIGVITSGCLSPTLEKSIAMGYIDAAQSEIGTTVDIDFGRQRIAATIVALPFYKAP